MSSIDNLDKIFFDNNDISKSYAEKVVSDALSGAEDGELYMQSSENESFSFDDGKLKMVWMEKPSWLTLVRFASQVLFYERIRLKKFNSISVKELRVTPTNTKKILIQIDGEHLPLKDDFLKIITLKHALEVIVPV